MPEIAQSVPEVTANPNRTPGRLRKLGIAVVGAVLVPFAALGAEKALPQAPAQNPEAHVTVVNTSEKVVDPLNTNPKQSVVQIFAEGDLNGPVTETRSEVGKVASETALRHNPDTVTITDTAEGPVGLLSNNNQPVGNNSVEIDTAIVQEPGQPSIVRSEAPAALPVTG
jgi:hypothetical protein